MRGRDLLPVALLGSIALFVVVEIAQRPDALRTVPRATEPQPAAAPAQPQGRPASVRHVEVLTSAGPAPERDLALVRSQIRDGAPGTYLLPMLEEEKQFLTRWPDRRMNALRVWIDRNPTVARWDQRYFVVAANAFDEWRLAGFPVAFDVVLDSTTTNIQIRWVTQFPRSGQNQIGVTKRRRDQHGWLISAEITIATHDADGDALPPATVFGAARHEIGHALGLGHSPDPADVMHALSNATVISASDRATLHLLYKLPPGMVK